jgi:dipeptidyl aminopeptidase/acylaminoacyl peptidase
MLHVPETGAPVPGVMFVHGLSGSRIGAGYLHVRTARALAEKGIASLRFDLAGAGESDGRFEDMTFTSQLADARAALGLLAADGRCEAGRIGLVGHSMGGCVAALLLDDARIRSCALLAAVASPSRIVDSQGREAVDNALAESGYLPYGPLRVGKGLVDETDTTDPVPVAARSSAHVLVMHGTADETVDPEHARMFERALTARPSGRTRVVWLPEMGHGPETPQQQDEVMARTVEWFVETL